VSNQAVECGIYSIVLRASGKAYVGSSANIRQRWRQHLCDLRRNRHRNPKLQASWNKYGEEAFDFSVIELCQIGDLLDAERRHLVALSAVACGFNIAHEPGRERAGAKHSEESLARMRASRKGAVLSSEHKAKLAIAFKGRAFSEETRRRISEAKTGKRRKPFTDQARANMSAGKKGLRHSDETRAKLSAAHKGKVMSEQARKNMSIAQRKRFAKA
jgi:group I intron endonuclease